MTIAPDDLDTPLLAEAGDTGLKTSGGTIYEEYLPSLRGRKGVETYQEMLDSPLPGAFHLLLDLMVSQVEWKAQPAIEGDEVAARWATFLEECLSDLDVSWTQVVSELLLAVPFGWARSEILYKLRRGPEADSKLLRSDFSDGLWGWRDFAPRSQDSLDRWERDGDELVGMHQRVDFRGTFFVPEAKTIAVIPRPWKRSPEGRSMYRTGYRPWFYSRKMEDFEALGIERDLTGLIYWQLPKKIMSALPGTPEHAVKLRYIDKVKKIRRGQMEGILETAEEEGNGIKSGHLVKLLASGGTGRISPDPTIRRHESRMMIAFLCEFLLLGMDKIGTNALGDAKSNTVNLAVRGILAKTKEPMNAKAIPDLYRLNGVPDEVWPTLEHSEVDAPGLVEMAQIITNLTGSSFVMPTAEDEEWARRKFGLASKPVLDAMRQQVASATTAPEIGGGAPAPVTALGGDTTVEDVTFKGPQLDAMNAIVAGVASGAIERISGLAQLRIGLRMTEADALAVMGTAGQAGGFRPAVTPAAPATSPARTESPPAAGA